MNKEEMKAKMDALNAKMKDLGEKTKDAVDTVKIKGMYAKDKIDEMASETKSNINAAKENFRVFSEKAKSKASSELLKAQMNIDVAKEELAAKKEAYDKASLENYIEEVIEYASACAELSILAAEEAKLATLEAVQAQNEYDEKYGNE
ncbi:MAG: hypothetical protein IKN63_03295 [Bacilli bacterium]|jgi:hypothetical protein|nr:hypothetical protein [Bacilli bacterium]